MNQYTLDYFMNVPPPKIKDGDKKLKAMTIVELRDIVKQLKKRNKFTEKNVLVYYEAWLTYYEAKEKSESEKEKENSKLHLKWKLASKQEFKCKKCNKQLFSGYYELSIDEKDVLCNHCIHNERIERSKENLNSRSLIIGNQSKNSESVNENAFEDQT